MSRDYQDQGALDEPVQTVDEVKAQEVKAPVDTADADTAEVK